MRSLIDVSRIPEHGKWDFRGKLNGESDEIERGFRTMLNDCELSSGRIARSLGLSKGSVSNYLSQAEAAGLTRQEALELDDAALLSRLNPTRYVRTRFAAPDFALVQINAIRWAS